MFEIIQYSLIALIFYLTKENSLNKSSKIFSNIVMYFAIVAAVSKAITLFILK